MKPFEALVAALEARDVRYAMIGTSGANYWAPDDRALIMTHDRDLFLPLEPANLLHAWIACDDAGYELSAGLEPLDEPRDLYLAERVTAVRGLTRARHVDDPLEIDLTLVMGGFEFEDVWAERRSFTLASSSVHVARLTQILESKRVVDRPKDRGTLATLMDAYRQIFVEDLGLPWNRHPPPDQH